MLRRDPSVVFRRDPSVVFRRDAGVAPRFDPGVLPGVDLGAAPPTPFRAALVAVVGPDDLLHQGVAHHVHLGEVADLDALDPPKDVAGLHQAAHRAVGQVHLRDVPGDHGLGVVAQPCEEHLHLLAGGVLRLVQDHEAVVEGAAPHEGQRGDLDDPPLDEGGGLLEGQQVVERVVQGPHVGVDLFLHGAGEKPEPFAGLHGGAREHDPAHPLLLVGEHGHGHGEVGLARARRPDGEHEVPLAQGLHVAFLGQAAGGDGARPGGDHHRVAEDVRQVHVRVLAQHVHGPAHLVGGQGDVAFGQGDELLHHPAAELHGRGGAVEPELAAAGVDVDAQPLLQQGQVGAALAEHGQGELVVLDGQPLLRLVLARGGGRVGGGGDATHLGSGR